jgi:hypothetical protein
MRISGVVSISVVRQLPAARRYVAFAIPLIGV